MNTISLLNKVPLDTGRSGGIGRAIATSLAASDSLVAIGYHNHEGEARNVVSECGDNAMIV